MTGDLKSMLTGIRERHKSYMPTEGKAVCNDDCNQPWPCDAIKEADALEVAVEALERVSNTNTHSGTLSHCTCSQTRRETLVSEALAAIEEKLRGDKREEGR